MGMDAVEPSVYFESPNNGLNFAPLFECLLRKRYPAESAIYELEVCPLMKGIRKTCNQYRPSETKMLKKRK